LPKVFADFPDTNYFDAGLRTCPEDYILAIDVPEDEHPTKVLRTENSLRRFDGGWAEELSLDEFLNALHRVCPFSRLPLTEVSDRVR